MYESMKQVDEEIEQANKKLKELESKKKQLLAEQALQKQINKKIQKIRTFYKKENKYPTHTQARCLGDLLEELKVGFRDEWFDRSDKMKQYIEILQCEVEEIEQFIVITEKYMEEFKNGKQT